MAQLSQCWRYAVCRNTSSDLAALGHLPLWGRLFVLSLLPPSRRRAGLLLAQLFSVVADQVYRVDDGDRAEDQQQALGDGVVDERHRAVDAVDEEEHEVHAGQYDRGVRQELAQHGGSLLS